MVFHKPLGIDPQLCKPEACKVQESDSKDIIFNQNFKTSINDAQSDPLSSHNDITPYKPQPVRTYLAGISPLYPPPGPRGVLNFKPKTSLPVYTPFRKRLPQVYNPRDILRDRQMVFTPQAGTLPLQLPSINTINSLIPIVKTLGIFLHQLKKCSTWADICIAIACAYKMHTGSSPSQDAIVIISGIMGCEFDTLGLLSAQGAEDITAQLRTVFDDYSTVCESKFVNKLHRLFTFIITRPLAATLGVDPVALGYTFAEADSLHKANLSSMSLHLSLMESVLFIVEKGVQYSKERNVRGVFHNSQTYMKFFDSHARIIREQNVSDPNDPTGSKMTLLIASTLAMGEAILVKATDVTNKSEAFAVNRMIGDIKKVRSKLDRAASSAKQRMMPLGIVIWGHPGTGKQTVLNKLINVYGVANYVEMRPYFRGNTKHWDACDNLRNVMVINDAAARVFNSNRPDPQLEDLIALLDTVPFCLPMAEAHEKGEVYANPEMVLITTNTVRLDGNLIFKNEAAMSRRVNTRFQVKVKPQFQRDGSTAIDVVKVQNFVAEHGREPDAWTYTVTQGHTVGDAFLWKTVLDEGDETETMMWFAKESVRHRTQALYMLNKSTTAVPLCEHFVSNCVICKSDSSTLKGQHAECIRPDMSPDSRYFAINSQPSNLFAKCISIIAKAINAFIYFVAILRILYYVIKILCKAGDTAHQISNYYSLWQLKDSIKSSYNTAWETHIPYKFAVTRQSMSDLGQKVKDSYYKHPQYAHLLIAGLTTSIALYKLSYRKIRPQGLNHSIPTPLPEGERVNTYKNVDVMTTGLPVRCMEPSALHPRDQVIKTLSGSQLYLELRDGERHLHINCVAVSSNIVVTNLHILRRVLTVEGIMCSLIRTKRGPGLNPNIDKFLLTPIDTVFDVENDLVLIRITKCPPLKNVYNFLPQQNATSFNTTGTSLYRNCDGVVDVTGVVHIRKGRNERYKSDEDTYYTGASPEYLLERSKWTFPGMCGSLLIGDRGAEGIEIFGIHCAGQNERAICRLLSKDVIDRLMSQFTNFVAAEISHIHLNSEESPNKFTTDLNLHTKCPLRWMETGTAEILATINKPRSTHTSSVKDTFMREYVREIMNLDTTVEPPVFGARSVHYNVGGIVNSESCLNNQILTLCADNLFEDLKMLLPASQLVEIHPIDGRTVVNGAPGLAWVDKMNFNTSMGHLWPGPKRRYLHPIDETSIHQEFTPGVMREVAVAEANYVDGYRNGSLFTAHNKDAPVTPAHNAIGKGRMFFGSDIVLTYLIRKYFLPIIRLFQNNKAVVESMVGLNASGADWGKLQAHVTQFGPENCIGGDFKNFDKGMSPQETSAAWYILYRLAELHSTESGFAPDGSPRYSHRDLKIMNGLITDVVYPIVNVNGELIQLFGSNPSGHPLTVTINGVVNSMYMRYAWATLNPEPLSVRDFKANVALVTYGDDNLMNVNPETSWFNHTSISDRLASVGITYTMAEKTAASVPFIHIDETSFLKRKFKYDKDTDLVLAPLEMASIAKMLNVSVLSDALTPQEQGVAIMRSANREFFFHGKAEFDTRHKQLLQVAQKSGLIHFFDNAPLSTYESINDSLDREAPFPL